MNEFEKLQLELANALKRIDILEEKVSQTGESSYKTGTTEIINHEVKFLQRVYDKNGDVVSEINP